MKDVKSSARPLRTSKVALIKHECSEQPEEMAERLFELLIGEIAGLKRKTH